MYIEISNELKNNNENKNIILTSYLYLIIVYEIVNLLKLWNKIKIIFS